MQLSSYQIAQMIDVSAVQAQNSEDEIRDLAGLAKQYGFIAVHALPNWTGLLSELLADRDDILVGGPVGFPSGGHTTEIKISEAESLLRDGVQEMDVMMNIGRLKSGDDAYVSSELRRLVEVAGDTPVKVIVEVYHLSQEELRRASLHAVDAGAAFVKTGTGWTPAATTVDVVERIKSYVGDAVRIKASGGIRDLQTMLQLYEAGAERFGINVQASMAILKECAAKPGGVVELS
jgi:deoxyribose-phosphate aldolase